MTTRCNGTPPPRCRCYKKQSFRLGVSSSSSLSAAFAQPPRERRISAGIQFRPISSVPLPIFVLRMERAGRGDRIADSRYLYHYHPERPVGWVERGETQLNIAQPAWNSAIACSMIKRRLWKAALVSLRVDVLERLKAPIAQSQGESGAALQASSPMRR